MPTEMLELCSVVGGEKPLRGEYFVCMVTIALP